jgi:dissimilatory sulfite reductase (desulfoviridin) alpha/beta subunit
MVLMEVRTSGGSIRRCDKRCYDAKHKKCTCVCGGKNHGVGLQKALENTKEDVLKMVERASSISETTKKVANFIREMVEQGELFAETKGLG